MNIALYNNTIDSIIDKVKSSHRISEEDALILFKEAEMTMV